MTREEAEALELWIHDHDTRFEAKAMRNDEDYVLLTRPEDGTRLPPVYSIEAFGTQYIEQDGPSPTIREKWEAWRAERPGRSDEAR